MAKLSKYFVRFLDGNDNQKEVVCIADSKADAMDYALFYYDVNKFLFVCEIN